MMSEKKDFIIEWRKRTLIFVNWSLFLWEVKRNLEKAFWPITDQDVTRAPQTDLF